MRSLTAISFSTPDHHQQLCKHISKRPSNRRRIKSCNHIIWKPSATRGCSGDIYGMRCPQNIKCSERNSRISIISRTSSRGTPNTSITLQAAAEAPGSLSSETSTPGGMLLVVPPMHMTMDPGPRISSASVNASTPVSGRFSWRCTMASGGKAANPIVSIVEDRMISAIISLPSSLSPLSPPPPPSLPPILSASSLFFLIVL